MIYTFRGTMSGSITGPGAGPPSVFLDAAVCITLWADSAAISGAGSAQLACPDRATITIAGLGVTATVREPGTLGVASGDSSILLLDLRDVRCLLGLDVPDEPHDLTTGFRVAGPTFQDAVTVPTDLGDLTITSVSGPVELQAAPWDPPASPRIRADWGAIARPSGITRPTPGRN